MTNNLQSLKNQSSPGVTTNSSKHPSRAQTDDIQAIVSTYANITNTETADEKAPQPSVAVDDFDQYGILNAYLCIRPLPQTLGLMTHPRDILTFSQLVMSDRAFLNALSVNKEFFSTAQRAQIRDIVSKQIDVVTVSTISSCDQGLYRPETGNGANVNLGSFA